MLIWNVVMMDGMNMFMIVSGRKRNVKLLSLKLNWILNIVNKKCISVYMVILVDVVVRKIVIMDGVYV